MAALQLRGDCLMDVEGRAQRGWSCAIPKTVNILVRAFGPRRLPRLAFLVFLGAITSMGHAAGQGEGAAVAIVYDTSGSMLQKVRDANGQMTAKNVIAHRAVKAVLNRLEAAASVPDAPPIHAGLIVFQGDHAMTAVKFGPFNARAFQEWLDAHDQPKAGTPLGDAVRVAGEAVLNSKLPRKHVLVITDGVNTRGPDPTATIPRLKQTAASRNLALSFHFVAFDVNANEFAGVKKLGATVVGAADEKQLNSHLEFIVARKILLEEEEPPTVQPQPK